ncbi:MAG: hypothetical protein JJT94_15885 [Bernardetiaceae bacterium]|nr:hypothetical protein [Bernardetiaceae bacterium]
MLLTLGLILGCLPMPLHAQFEYPKGHFLKKQEQKSTDSIGAYCFYAISFRHRPDVEVFFPDSTSRFGNFEYVFHEYFPTRTNFGTQVSLDSAIYTLRTFSMDTLQRLKTSVLIIQKGGDSLVLATNEDSLRLGFALNSSILEAAESTPDSLFLHTNSLAVAIPSPFNYPLWILICMGLSLISIAAYLLFGKRVSRYYHLRRLEKLHENFMLEYEYTISKAEIERAEQALRIWKNYIQKIRKEPFSSYTSKEIAQITQNTSLSEGLHAIDRAVYAKRYDTKKIEKAFLDLKQFALDNYKQKIEEFKHA